MKSALKKRGETLLFTAVEELPFTDFKNCENVLKKIYLH